MNLKMLLAYIGKRPVLNPSRKVFLFIASVVFNYSVYPQSQLSYIIDKVLDTARRHTRTCSPEPNAPK